MSRASTAVIAVVALVLVFNSVSSPVESAAAWAANGEDREDYNDIEVPEVIHRRADGWCARWGEPCVVESRVKFTQCCDGLTCSCSGGLFKNGGKCSCKNASLLGRR